MEQKVKFGPSGNSEIFYNSGYKKSIDAPKFCAEKGLFAYEYSFDIDVNTEISFIYRAFQENGKSDYRKVFSITVYEKVGDA